MKRLFSKLGTRLIIAMLLVALFSSLVIIASQAIGARLHFLSLPAEVRAEIIERGRRPPPPLNFVPRPEGEVLQGPPPATIARETFVTSLATVQDYQRRATYIGIALAAVLASLLAAFLARTISKPIERVSQAASSVAAGDLAVRVPDQLGVGQEVKTLMLNFNMMAASLERGELERRAMVADIAHELRTPLAAMKLRFQGLEDALIPLDVAQVKRLHAQTNVLVRLVEDLRTLSLVDAGRLPLQKRKFDVAKLLNDLCDSFQIKAQSQKIKLVYHVIEQPIQANLDPERLTQMLSNLVDNAIRVTPEDGAVSVSLEQAENLIITVRDTGPGLSEESLEHLFDRFYQDRDTKGSSGLGLAIVKALAELHGGAVSAGNSDCGAWFRLCLPV